MSIFAQLKNSLSGLFESEDDSPKQIGIYGPTNAGKTTLSNRICREFLGEDMGPASHVPHETRRVNKQEEVVIERDDQEVSINIVDTPGVETKVDKDEFIDHGFDKEDSVRRSREAAQGISEAMHWLREDIDGVIYVVDSTRDPLTQVNNMLLGIIEDRGVPILILANKIDRDDSDVEFIRETYEESAQYRDKDYTVVPMSAKEGDNIDAVYDKIAEKFG